MKAAIVILNRNTKDYLRRFLPALLRSVEGLDAQVIVADNGSTDGSLELLDEHFPEVRQIRFDMNYGFTGGYNRALTQIDAEYFVLINSDIEVPEGWLKPLLNYMDSHPRCGACGPKLHSWFRRDWFEYAGAAGGLIDACGYPFCRGRVLKRVEKDCGQYDSAEGLLWVSGACMMIRKSVWDSFGGFDERFFAHMEEIDLCWRMQLKGWDVAVVPESTVYHLGGGTLPQNSPFKLKLNYRNNLLALSKNLARTYFSMGMDAETAVRKAEKKIARRMTLDWLSAMAYLLSWKKDYYDAVKDAHREYRFFRSHEDAPDTSLWEKECTGKVQGISGARIIPASILKGKRVFKYLMNYENRH